jgi:hypothetical protein
MTRAIEISRDLVGLGGGTVVRQSDGRPIDQTCCDRTMSSAIGTWAVGLRRPRKLVEALLSEVSQAGQINGCRRTGKPSSPN